MYPKRVLSLSWDVRREEADRAVVVYRTILDGTWKSHQDIMYLPRQAWPGRGGGAGACWCRDSLLLLVMLFK